MRPLFASERAFLERYFGSALDCEPIRVGWSPGRRSWSPWGARISLSRRNFIDRTARREVALASPASAAVFAHEAIHVWQRQLGRAVTRAGAYWQTLYLLRLHDPYAYDESLRDPTRLQDHFVHGNIEQQGRIFQDYVFADLSGGRTERFAGVARWVRTSRERV